MRHGPGPKKLAIFEGRQASRPITEVCYGSHQYAKQRVRGLRSSTEIRVVAGGLREHFPGGGTHPGFVFKDKKHLVIEKREEEAELFREQLEEGHRGWFWEPKESRHGSHQA